MKFKIFYTDNNSSLLLLFIILIINKIIMNKWINWKEKVSDYYYKTENSMKCKNKKLFERIEKII
jgi:hypothetical protein